MKKISDYFRKLTLNVVEYYQKEHCVATPSKVPKVGKSTI